MIRVNSYHKLKILGSLIACLFFISTLCTNAQSTLSNPEELGKVLWLRDYDQAIAEAKKQQKDIVILFQEVPGCATCRNYGHNVLSQPLLVEALENSFIPLAIFNNKTGKDRKILNKYNEPSWNNPVVRIIDEKGMNIVDRIGGDYSAVTLSKRLIQALQLRNKVVPEYLHLLAQELASHDPHHRKEKYFKMYCFWTGEKELGALDGVINVEAGFIDHHEVVKVNYDPAMINEKALTEYAANRDFEVIDRSKEKGYRVSSKDIRYYLQHSHYQYLPLSETQKTKINTALGKKQDAEMYLSPKQKNWLEFIRMDSSNKLMPLFDQKLGTAWEIMEEHMSSSGQ